MSQIPFTPEATRTARSTLRARHSSTTASHEVAHQNDGYRLQEVTRLSGCTATPNSAIVTFLCTAGTLPTQQWLKLRVLNANTGTPRWVSMGVHCRTPEQSGFYAWYLQEWGSWTPGRLWATQTAYRTDTHTAKRKVSLLRENTPNRFIWGKD